MAKNKKASKKAQLASDTVELKALFRKILGEPKLPEHFEDNFGFYSGYFQALEDVARLLLTTKGMTWKKPNTTTPAALPTPQVASAGTSTST